MQQFSRQAVTATTQPGGFKSTLSYDSAGRVITRSLQDSYRQVSTTTHYAGLATIANQPETVIQNAWLIKGTQTQAQDSSSALRLRLFTAQFNAQGQLTQSTDSAGRTIVQHYDSAGRMLGIADGQGYKSQATLDTEGRTQVAGLYLPASPTNTSSSTPTQPYRAAYSWHDELGRLTRRLLPDGRLDAYTYDRQGQLSEHQQSHGQGADILHNYRSNAAHTVQAHIAHSADGWLRVNLRAAHNTPMPSPDISQSGQTKLGQPSTLADDFGRIVRQHLPDHGSKTATYDAAGRITQLHSADGSLQSYQYDSAGRLVQRSYQSAPDTRPTMQAQMHYQGRLLASVTDPAQTVHYNYDALGRETGENIQLTALNQSAHNPSPKALHTATRYDSATGLVKARILADGKTMRTRRSSAKEGATAQGLALQSAWAAWLQDRAEELLPHSLASLLVKALPAEQIAQDIRIHPFNGLTGYQAGNGLTTAKTYDIAGRMTQLTTDKVSTLDYGYGIGPRIQTIKPAAQPTSSSAKLLNASYQYTSFGGLVDEAEPAKTANATPKDNSIAIKVRAAPAAFQRTAGLNDAKNRPPNGTASIPNSSTSSPTEPANQYDDLGRTQEDGQRRYSYSPSGQVETVSDIATGKLIAQYRYNSQHQRVSKTVTQAGQEPSTTYYLWQANRLVAELNQKGQITSQYLYLSQSEGQVATPIAKLESSHNVDNASKSDRVLFIHADHRATPVAMTDSTQKIVWLQELTPRGMMKAALLNSAGAASDSAVLNIRLPGQYFDAETGLHDNLHRTYNPQTGRYLQPDPLGYPDGPDAYLYAGGDPVNHTDSLGLYTEYWGGAGLDGPYIADQIAALSGAGITNVRRGYGSGGSGLLGTILDANAVINLRTNPAQYGYLTPRAPYAPAPRQRKRNCEEQTNYIGYSYGSLLAAHTALHYADRGNVIDNLVLIGSPIDTTFLQQLQNHRSINFVTVINLTDKGDPIFAGMSEFDLLRGIPTLASDFLTPGKGHFYYAPDTEDGRSRRRELATYLAAQGLK